MGVSETARKLAFIRRGEPDFPECLTSWYSRLVDLKELGMRS